MPRKQRVPKPRQLDCSPAWIFVLMVGTPARCRLRGWVEFEYGAERLPTGEYSWAVAGDALWHQHREALMDEADAHGFVPFWHGKRTPHGDGFAKWREQFLRLHTY